MCFTGCLHPFQTFQRKHESVILRKFSSSRVHPRPFPSVCLLGVRTTSSCSFMALHQNKGTMLNASRFHAEAPDTRIFSVRNSECCVPVNSVQIWSNIKDGEGRLGVCDGVKEAKCFPDFGTKRMRTRVHSNSTKKKNIYCSKTTEDSTKYLWRICVSYIYFGKEHVLAAVVQSSERSTYVTWRQIHARCGSTSHISSRSYQGTTAARTC